MSTLALQFYLFDSHPIRFKNPFELRERDDNSEDNKAVLSKFASIPISDEELDEEDIDDMIAGPLGMAALDAIPDEKDDTISPGVNFVIASLAGIFASILTHPFDVLRTQMQLSTYRPEGSQLVVVPEVPKLMRPGTIQQISGLPMTGQGGSQLVVNSSTAVPTIATDRTKLKVHVPEAPAPPTRPVPRGARVTIETLESGTRRPGIVRFTYNMVATEGFSVFWKGLIPRLARRTLATALAWTAFEELNQQFVQQFGSQKVQDPTTVTRD